jgi:hypothetical protein
MNLDGYYYPTQPGDVNDLRTWCHVNESMVDDFNYSCESSSNIDEGTFGAVYSMVDNFTFHAATSMQDYHVLKDAFKAAYKRLLKDETVLAITCSVGFCAAYQDQIDAACSELYRDYPNLPRKPSLLGTPALMAAFAPRVYGNKSWRLLKNPETEAVIVMTSYYPTMSDYMAEMLELVGVSVGEPYQVQNTTWQLDLAKQLQKKLGMFLSHIPARYRGTAGARIVVELYAATNDVQETLVNSKNFVPVGWNNNPGYNPVVVGGGFHNVALCLDTYKPQLDCVLRSLKESTGRKPIAFIMESTEMPAHSNTIRKTFNLPVWDISTLGMCVMKASKTYQKEEFTNMFAALFLDPSFSQCMMSWYTTAPVYEHKFGQQEDGSVMFYNDSNTHIVPEHIFNMTCAGGRPPTLQGGVAKTGRLMGTYNPGLPKKPGDVREVCWTTGLCKCSVKGGSYGPSCSEACPGSGNCGGGNWGPQPALPDGTDGYPCGAQGHACPLGNETKTVLDPNSIEIVTNSNSCTLPDNDSDSVCS